MASTNDDTYKKSVEKVFVHEGVHSGRLYTFHPTAPYLYYIMYDPQTNLSGFYEYNYSNPAAAAAAKPRRVGDNFLESPVKALSKEEELLRQRMHENFSGVTRYTFNSGTLDFLIPFGRTLIIYNVSDPANPKVRVVWRDCAEPRLDTKLSPDGHFVSYIYNSDLWILPLIDGAKPVKVTDSKVRPNFTCGSPDFILEEEFLLFTGYFVCPTYPSGNSNEYRVLYLEVDSNDVEDHISQAYESSFESPEKFKYPRVATPNSRVTLCMMDFTIGADGSVNVLRVGRVDQTLCGLYPNAEYFTRLGWCRDGKRIYVQIMDRRQRNLDVVLIEADAFFGSGKKDEFAAAVTVMKKQTDEHWINVFDMFEELEDGSFIWATEESPNGFMRLVRLIPKDVGTRYECIDLFESSESLYAINGGIAVDEKNKLVAFLGHEKTPLQKRCFVLSYESNKGEMLVKKPLRVSSDKFSTTSFAAKFAADGRSAVFAFEQSSFSSTPFASVVNVDFIPDTKVKSECIAEAKLIGTLFSSKFNEDLIVPKTFNFVSKRHGERLYGCYFEPRKPICEKCPVVVSIYGGTFMKRVNDEYSTTAKEQRQLYAANGMYVVCLDNVGCFERGHKFETYIDEKMGTVELDDQIEALHYVADVLKLPIDLSRIAIFGWSYGGYMSLMAIAQHPEVFKISLVGAPVTTWERYDTGYTERYMGIPTTTEVKEAYKAGSVLTYLDGIPKDKTRIALVHGLSDENVHYEHTLGLIKEFKKKGIPFEIRTYPGQRHYFENFEYIKDYQTFYLEFLMKNI